MEIIKFNEEITLILLYNNEDINILLTSKDTNDGDLGELFMDYTKCYLNEVRSSIKGAGKFMICTAIRIGIEKGFIKSNKIGLSAQIYSETVDQIKRNLGSTPDDLFDYVKKNNGLRTLLREYVSKSKTEVNPTRTPEQLKEFINDCDRNKRFIFLRITVLLQLRKLVKYYTDNYGFKPIKSIWFFDKDSEAGLEMEVELQVILNVVN